jgi:putative photosynthetic complex assembly protein 2
MDFSSPWTAALLALFTWWFATGAILYVVKRADREGRDAHVWSVLLGLPVLFAGVVGFLDSLDDASVGGIYWAFFSALLIWGWIELAFLSGVVTGPNRRVCPAGTPEWERFLRAWGTIAYHEMLLAVTLVLMGWLAWNADNAFGFWTFALLFFARVTAKLNLFFGVPKINTEFLPEPLRHLPSHFRFSKMNAFFPVSVTALTFALGCWFERLYAVNDPAQLVGFALLASMTALALLEHWFMVLPLPDEKLWRWMIPAPKPGKKLKISEDPHGF